MPNAALTFEELKALDKRVAEGPLSNVARDAAFGAFVGAVVGLLDGGVIGGAVKGAGAGAALSIVSHHWEKWLSDLEHDARGDT
jgi:hypothetical protein